MCACAERWAWGSLPMPESQLVRLPLSCQRQGPEPGHMFRLSLIRLKRHGHDSSPRSCCSRGRPRPQAVETGCLRAVGPLPPWQSHTSALEKCFPLLGAVAEC